MDGYVVVLAPLVGGGAWCRPVTRELHVFQKCFNRFPGFSAIFGPFQDPKFIRSRSEGVSDLLDENSVNGGRVRNHSGHARNI